MTPLKRYSETRSKCSTKEAFPDIRVLGANPYTLRRVVLWAPELQVSLVTEESHRRTEMVQSQIVREASRKLLSHEDFLASIAPIVSVFEVRPGDRSFARTFELLNKTNQFNTTGRRWHHAELVSFADNGRIFAFNVEDKHTSYGLVGVVLIEDDVITQFVMSCRVFGLEAEFAAMSVVLDHIHARPIYAEMVQTPKNMPAQGFWQNLGFSSDAGRYRLECDQSTNRPRAVKAVYLDHPTESDRKK